MLLQVVLEVLGDPFVKVDALVSRHVVTLTWINEEVGLGAGFGTSIQEL